MSNQAHRGGAVRADSNKEGAAAPAAPSAEPAVESPAVEPETTEDPKPSVGKVYRVAKGHGLTTISRGIRGEGEEVVPADVTLGEARLAELALKGVLTLS